MAERPRDSYQDCRRLVYEECCATRSCENRCWGRRYTPKFGSKWLTVDDRHGKEWRPTESWNIEMGPADNNGAAQAAATSRKHRHLPTWQAWVYLPALTHGHLWYLWRLTTQRQRVPTTVPTNPGSEVNHLQVACRLLRPSSGTVGMWYCGAIFWGFFHPRH
jgi:hypothetical protein